MKKELDEKQLKSVNGGEWEGWSQQYFSTNEEAMAAAQQCINNLTWGNGGSEGNPQPGADYKSRRFEVINDGVGICYNYYVNE